MGIWQCLETLWISPRGGENTTGLSWVGTGMLNPLPSQDTTTEKTYPASDSNSTEVGKLAIETFFLWVWGGQQKMRRKKKKSGEFVITEYQPLATCQADSHE